MFSDAEIISTSVGVDDEIVLKYIKDYLNGTIPDNIVKPKEEC